MLVVHRDHQFTLTTVRLLKTVTTPLHTHTSPHPRWHHCCVTNLALHLLCRSLELPLRRYMISSTSVHGASELFLGCIVREKETLQDVGVRLFGHYSHDDYHVFSQESITKYEHLDGTATKLLPA